MCGRRLEETDSLPSAGMAMMGISTPVDNTRCQPAAAKRNSPPTAEEVGATVLAAAKGLQSFAHGPG